MSCLRGREKGRNGEGLGEGGGLKERKGHDDIDRS